MLRSKSFLPTGDNEFPIGLTFVSCYTLRCVSKKFDPHDTDYR